MKILGKVICVCDVGNQPNGVVMIVPINHHTWQLLRVLVREKKAVIGRMLRLDMSRRTKDGVYLGKLVEQGYIEIVKSNEDPFKRTYAITPAGRHAAEYGEVDADLEGKLIWPGTTS